MKPHFFSLARNGVREGAEKETNHLNEQGLGFCNFQKCFLADKDPRLLLLIYKSGKLFLRLISLPFARLKGHYIQMDCPSQCGWRSPRQITSHLIKFEFLFYNGWIGLASSPMTDIRELAGIVSCEWWRFAGVAWAPLRCLPCFPYFLSCPDLLA